MTLTELMCAGIGFMVGSMTIGIIAAKWQHDTVTLTRRQLMKVAYYLNVQDYSEAKATVRAAVEALQ